MKLIGPLLSEIPTERKVSRGRPKNTFKAFRESFFGRINKTKSCWIWTGKLLHGYGRVALNNREILAHRLSWFFAHGEIPENKLVCHKCDNTLCVNPSHLFIGTQTDNMRDCSNKNRLGGEFKKGILPHNTRLSFDDVRNIRQRITSGETLSSIARFYGHTVANISDIKRGKNWGWLK